MQILSSSDNTFRFWWHIQILTYSDYDTFRFWHFQFLTLSDSDTFRFWHFQILTLSDSASFKFWHFQILTLSDSDTFRFCLLQILTLSDSDTFKFEQKKGFDTFMLLLRSAMLAQTKKMSGGSKIWIARWRHNRSTKNEPVLMKNTYVTTQFGLVY